MSEFTILSTAEGIAHAAAGKSPSTSHNVTRALTGGMELQPCRLLYLMQHSLPDNPCFPEQRLLTTILHVRSRVLYVDAGLQHNLSPRVPILGFPRYNLEESCRPKRQMLKVLYDRRLLLLGRVTLILREITLTEAKRALIRTPHF